MPTERIITAITASERNPRRMLVKTGGRTVATLSVRAIMELGLTIGTVWDEALAERIDGASVFERAMEAAMRAINRRALSRRRVQDKLRSLGYDEAVTAEVLERLTKTGAIDDEALGRTLVEEIQSRKPAGPALLRAKLRQRGLENRLIEQLMSEAADDPRADPVGAAAQLVRKRLRSVAGLDPKVKKRRLWGLLARRGFNSETIEQALARVDELRAGTDG